VGPKAQLPWEVLTQFIIEFVEHKPAPQTEDEFPGRRTVPRHPDTCSAGNTEGDVDLPGLTSAECLLLIITAEF
jgi:hypothetical protein